MNTRRTQVRMKERVTMSQETILREIFDYANRANPYPLWAHLPQTPVGFQEDAPAEGGTYVVSTYREIEALLHDPPISSDSRNVAQTVGHPRPTTVPARFLNLHPPHP